MKFFKLDYKEEVLKIKNCRGKNSVSSKTFMFLSFFFYFFTDNNKYYDCIPSTV